MKELLSFEQAPPFDVPLRFLLSAVPFGFAAGVLLVFSGDALGSRWSPQTLALTHLFTVGFMLQAMCGALLQLTPVAIGANVANPRAVAAVAHPTLLLGALFLVAAFLTGRTWLFLAASLGLGVGTAVIASVVLIALTRAPVANPSRNTMRLAIGGLLVTATLGIALALIRGGIPAPVELLSTTTHLRFGWLAWGLALICGASFLVVPMFQLTPQYPARFQRFFVPLLLLVLGAGLTSLPAALVVSALCALAATYAGTTLWLQQRRRRPRTDHSFMFWRIALISTIAASLLASALSWGILPEQCEVVLGILVLVGGFDSVICAMMYKIVPFLTWLHLNNAGADPLLMHQVIEEKRIGPHLRLHLAALLTALPVPWLPTLAIPAGLLLAGAHAVQGFNMYLALRRYCERRRTAPAVAV